MELQARASSWKPASLLAASGPLTSTQQVPQAATLFKFLADLAVRAPSGRYAVAKCSGPFCTELAHVGGPSTALQPALISNAFAVLVSW